MKQQTRSRPAPSREQHSTFPSAARDIHTVDSDTRNAEQPPRSSAAEDATLYDSSATKRIAILDPLKTQSGPGRSLSLDHGGPSRRAVEQQFEGILTRVDYFPLGRREDSTVALQNIKTLTQRLKEQVDKAFSQRLQQKAQAETEHVCLQCTSSGEGAAPGVGVWASTTSRSRQLISEPRPCSVERKAIADEEMAEEAERQQSAANDEETRKRVQAQERKLELEMTELQNNLKSCKSHNSHLDSQLTQQAFSSRSSQHTLDTVREISSQFAEGLTYSRDRYTPTVVLSAAAFFKSLKAFVSPGGDKLGNKTLQKPANELLSELQGCMPNAEQIQSLSVVDIRAATRAMAKAVDDMGYRHAERAVYGISSEEDRELLGLILKKMQLQRKAIISAKLMIEEAIDGFRVKYADLNRTVRTFSTELVAWQERLVPTVTNRVSQGDSIAEIAEIQRMQLDAYAEKNAELTDRLEALVAAKERSDSVADRQARDCEKCREELATYCGWQEEDERLSLLAVLRKGFKVMGEQIGKAGGNEVMGKVENESIRTATMEAGKT